MTTPKSIYMYALDPTNETAAARKNQASVAEKPDHACKNSKQRAQPLCLQLQVKEEQKFHETVLLFREPFIIQRTRKLTCCFFFFGRLFLLGL